MPEGKPVYQWLIENGVTLQDLAGIDPMFLMDSNYLIYDEDLSPYGDFTGLALGPNFRSVEGNAHSIGDKLGIDQGQRGLVVDTKRIDSEAKKNGLDPRQLLVNRLKHEMHHSANDGMPGISESMAYAFGDGQKVNGKAVPFKLDDAWRATARELNDPRDLWEMLPNPTATSSASAEPVGFRPASPMGFRAPPAPRESRLQFKVDRLSTSNLLPR